MNCILSWRNRKTTCREAEEFLTVQQSFYCTENGDDLPSAARFLNGNVVWRASSLLVALSFTRNFLSSPTFNMRYSFGIQTSDNPESYNIIMLLILAEKHDIDIDNDSTSQSIYAALCARHLPNDQLIEFVKDRIWSMPRIGLEYLYRKMWLQTPQSSYTIPLWRRYDSRIAASDYPDLPHLAYVEGCDIVSDSSDCQTALNWLQKHQVSFYFADQVDSYPSQTIFENETNEISPSRLIVSPDQNAVCSIDELSQHQPFVHPFAPCYDLHDIRKLQRRFSDIPLSWFAPSDYRQASLEDWNEVYQLSQLLRSDQDCHLQLFNLPTSVYHYILFQDLSGWLSYLPYNVAMVRERLLMGVECRRVQSNYLWDLAVHGLDAWEVKVSKRPDFQT